MEIGTRDITTSDMKALSLYKQESIEHLRAKPGLIKRCINEVIPLFKYLKDQWDEKDRSRHCSSYTVLHLCCSS